MSARITRHEVSVALCFTSEPSFVAQNPRLGECAGADSEERERVPGAATFVATKERDRRPVRMSSRRRDASYRFGKAEMATKLALT